MRKKLIGKNQQISKRNSKSRSFHVYKGEERKKKQREKRTRWK